MAKETNVTQLVEALSKNVEVKESNTFGFHLKASNKTTGQEFGIGTELSIPVFINVPKNSVFDTAEEAQDFLNKVLVNADWTVSIEEQGESARDKVKEAMKKLAV